MRNRAKCKLCKSVIESYHRGDYVNCKCGEIGISGGNDVYECVANDWDNFIRVDDQDNEILVRVIDTEDLGKEANEGQSKADLHEMLEEMINNIERLPEEAMSTYVTHYDLLSFMILVNCLMKKIGE